MRILMLAQTYAPVVGGEERLTQDLSVELAKRGHEVSVATLRQPLGEPPAQEGVRIHLLDSSVHEAPGISVLEERRYAPPGPDPRTARQLRQLLEREQPDVVHAHNWLAHSYLPSARRTAAPLVLSLHDYSLVCATKRLFLDGGVCSGPAPRKCLSHSLEYYGAAKGAMIACGMAVSAPWLRRRVDLYLPVSTAVEEESRLPAGAARRIVPNFVRELPPSPPAGDPRLAALPDEPFVLYFGDLTEDKGVLRLVEAHRGIERPPPLVLVGRDQLECRLTGPGIHPVGPLPHELTIEAVRRSLFTVAPSLLPESFGIVALEGAAAGKPVIASDIGGLRDVVRDGETGFLVAPGDVAGLRGAMERLIGDPALRERMGSAAATRARDFSAGAVVPMFEDAYEAAIAARRRD
ncbi:MAG TPA: glycosyltransferase family 4 protein [Solirubrobacterales bacterium]|nr:glycosyltransferase family 4 protein [Solirubrobacterales bacterium]